MGKRKRCRMVDVCLQNGRPSDDDKNSTTESVQNGRPSDDDRNSTTESVQNEAWLSAAQACSQSGSPNGGSSSDNPIGDNYLDEASGSGASSDKKQRGPTLMAHIWNQPKGKRIVVEWNNRWQPINNEASDLAYFLGTIARNPMLCSLSYNDWRRVPKQEKNQLLKIVKSKFIIPNQEAERYVLKSIGRKWSNYKVDLRLKRYEPNHLKSVDDIMNNHRPDFVPKDQWISMVSHWVSEKGRYRSNKNRESRSKQVMVHTAGSKSFARVAAEMAVDGVEPSRAHVYLDTHKDRKIDPKPMDAKSKEAVDGINEKLCELPNGKEITDGNVAWEGDIYSQVMKTVVGPERRGQVRGVGMVPKSFVSISSTQPLDHIDHDDHDHCAQRLELLEADNRRMKADNEIMRADYEIMRADNDRMRAELTELRRGQTQILVELASRRDLESSMDENVPSTSTREEIIKLLQVHLCST